MRKTILFGQKFSVLGIGTGGGSLQPKIINVPADYPTLIEANTNMGRHYYIGGDPSVTDNDPTKTNTGQTFLLGQDIMWDGVSAYFKVGDNAIWVLDGAGNVKTVTPQNINMQGKGLKNINLWTTIKTTDGDYTDINTAIAAAKYNLRVVGDFTQLTDVVSNANLLTLMIAEKLRVTDKNFSIGSGGVKVNGNIIPIFTGATNRLFTSIPLALLNLENCFIDMTGCTDPASGIASMYAGSQHKIHNCKFALSNNSDAGFLQPGANSSFTNLEIIGGGVSCNAFITSLSASVISNWFVSGVFASSSSFLNFITTPSILSNIIYTGTNEIRIDLNVAGMQLNNVKGKFNINCAIGGNNLISNCEVSMVDLLNATNNNHLANVITTSAAAMEISGDQNRFENVTLAGNLLIYGDNNWFNNVKAAHITITGDNNHLLIAVGTTYTDSGTGNIIITGISDDETLSADSPRLLATQRAIKAYADNIAKGITVDYYFSNTPDGVIPSYDIMFPADTGEVESTAAAAIPAEDTLIQPFVTQTTEPNFTTLLAGIYDIHIHAAKTAGTKDAFIYAEFYKRTYPGGVETLLSTSDNSAILTGSNTGYTLHFSLTDDEILNATDRLVVKFYGSPSGVGTDPTVTLYLEGTNSSRIDIHTTSSSWMLNLQNVIYRNGAGNDSNDGKNMGTPKKTLAAAIIAAIAQSPSSSNMITIKDLGGARIDEDITLPSWCILDTCDAHVVGQVTLGVTMAADSHFYFNKASPEAGSECIRISGTGTRYIRGNSTGAALNSTFIVAGGGAVVYLDIVNANAVATGAKFSTFTTGAVLFLNAQTFRETVASTSAGATVFRNVADDGANADTTNINETGNQIIRGKDKLIYGTSIADVLELYGVGAKWLTNPHFIAYNNAPQPDITGDATLADIIMTQTDKNTGNHYNTVSGVFTAPTTGFYFFNIIVFVDGLIATHNDVNIRLLTTTANWYLIQGNPQYMKSGASGDLILNGSAEVLMNSGNTAKFQIQVSGASKVVDVQIGSTCSGRLITR